MKPNLEEFAKYHKTESLLVMAKLRPVRHILFVSYTSSNDEPVLVPCTIDESRYKMKDGYKVAIKSIYEGFGGETYYLSDFNSLWHSGAIKVFVEVI